MPFKLEDWGGYYSIGFLGKGYFAGYAQTADVGYPLLYERSDDENCTNDGMLLTVLRDDDEEIIVKEGSSLLLEDGYELLIKSIDIGGDKVNVELYNRAGQPENKSVVSPVKSDATVKDRTYLYRKDIGKIKDIVILAVHFKNAFYDGNENLATIDGIFQLSEIPEPVMDDMRYDSMIVSDLDSAQMSIAMNNEDSSIKLNKNKDAALMEGIRIRVANPEDSEMDKPLRFYIYKKMTAEGLYEIKGDVKETVIGATYSYDADDFPGFYYDLDDNLGKESLTIEILGDAEDWMSNYLDVIYKTDAERAPFNLTRWGEYYFIGYLGERYFAGYVENSTDPEKYSYLCDKSDDKNLISKGYISRVLIDSDEEKVLGKGSTIKLSEGYQINIIDIDASAGSEKATVRLSKDGEEIPGEDLVVVDIDEEDPKTSSYCYEKSLGKSGDLTSKIVTIALNFKNAFESHEAELVTINGTWQISDNPEKIEENDEIDNMTISEVSSAEGGQFIKMRNEDHILKLKHHNSIHLIKDFYIKTADQEVTDSNPLRFYIYREAIIRNSSKGEDPIEEPQPAKKPEIEPSIDNNSTESEPPAPAKGTPGFAGFMAISLLLMASCPRIRKK
jgi:S-layer protein (TIGR01567 family)